MKARKRVLGQEHPDTLTSMANLASTYRNQRRWKEAEELEVQVVETKRQTVYSKFGKCQSHAARPRNHPEHQRNPDRTASLRYLWILLLDPRLPGPLTYSQLTEPRRSVSGVN